MLEALLVMITVLLAYYIGIRRGRREMMVSEASNFATLLRFIKVQADMLLRQHAQQTTFHFHLSPHEVIHCEDTTELAQLSIAAEDVLKWVKPRRQTGESIA